MTFTLTLSNPLREGVNKPNFRKWDITKFANDGKESIVIRAKDVGTIGSRIHSVQYTMYPYKRYKKRWKQWLWFKWLKLRVWIGDLYKS